MKTNDRISSMLANPGLPHIWGTLGAVLLLAWPAIIEQIMLTLVQYVDTAMVGTLGSEATAAVGLTSSTTWLFNGLFNAASVGFSVQVAQHLGAGRREEAQKVTWQGLRFVGLFGISMGAIGFVLSFFLPAMLGADPAIRGNASLYFRIMSCAMPFTLASNMFSAIIRCSGDTRTPMILNLMINVLNVILNTLFIYSPRTVTLFGNSFFVWGAGLGVAGAAFASALSTATVACLFILVIFRKKSPVQISLRHRYSFDKACLLTTWRLGLPVALERATMSIAQIVITSIITGIGTVAVAANHLAVTAESISYLPASGVAVAGTTLVGQAIGGGRKDLARRFARTVSWMGVVIMTFGGAILFFLCSPAYPHFLHRPRGHRPGQPGVADRGLCRADVRCLHCGVWLPAGRRRLPWAVHSQPVHHVGRTDHPVLPIGRAVGAHRRMAGYGCRALRTRFGVHDPPIPRQMAAH